MSELIVSQLGVAFVHDPVGCPAACILGGLGLAVYVNYLGVHRYQISESWREGVTRLGQWRDALLPNAAGHPDLARAQWEWRQVLRRGPGRHRRCLLARRTAVALALTVALVAGSDQPAQGTTHTHRAGPVAAHAQTTTPIGGN